MNELTPTKDQLYWYQRGFNNGSASVLDLWAKEVKPYPKGLTEVQVNLLWDGVKEEAIKTGESLNWTFYKKLEQALYEVNK